VAVVCGALFWCGLAGAQGINPAPTPMPVPAAGAAGVAPTPPTPGTATFAPVPTVAECFPACRSGFTCHEGQCISLCNPACGADERCLPNGECEREAPATSRSGDSEDNESKPVRRRRHRADDEANQNAGAPSDIWRPEGTWVFAARAGFGVFGGGHVENHCTDSGEQSSCGADNSDGVDDKSLFMLGIDGLVHVASGVRLGAGYQLVPYSSLKDDIEHKTVHLGHEHALNAIVEGLLPLGPRLALALRAHGGLRMLVIGGDLAESGDRFLKNCRNSVGHCEVDQGPLFGGGFGGMVGIVGRGKTRWRIDLALDRFSMKLPSSKVVSDGVRTQSSTMYDTRTWILGGLEL
jgi:hypothetical protein